MKILRKCNNPDYIKFFRDKSEFNKVFSEQLHREYLDLNTSTPESFSLFYAKHKDIFIKEVLGCRGNSVAKYSFTDDESALELYGKLKKDTSGHYVAENMLIEHHSLADFHPESVNTLRFVTLYDNTSDTVHFMSTRIRIGNNGYNVDNFHYGGIGANIDIETGIISSLGYNASDREFLLHPMTQKQIIGFQIPNWQECKLFVEKCARVIPEVRYVGWDVVPLENGEFALLEGNDNADHDFQQMHYRGMWKDYKNIIKKF